MSRELSSYDSASRLRQLRENGWCAFESFFDEGENEAMAGRQAGRPRPVPPIS